MAQEKVAIIGASPKPDRYAYKANSMLHDYGHETFLIHPKLKEIEGQKVYSSPADVEQLGEKIDTVTMYVNRDVSSKMDDQLINLKPRRVIFNPGAENPELAARLEGSGIATLEACTLVLLRTGQF